MLIVVPLYNKLSMEHKLFINRSVEFIEELERKLMKYQYDNVCQVDYEIAIITDIWQTGIPINILEGIFYFNKDHLLDIKKSSSDTLGYAVFNKGANLNMLVKILEKENKNPDWIVIQELFLQPNENIIPYYFLEPKNGEILKLSHFYEPFLDKDRLGIFSISLDSYKFYRGFNNNMMNFDKCDRLFINNATSKGAVVREITKTDSMNFIASYPKYHTMERNPDSEFGVYIDRKTGDLNNTIIDEYEKKMIRKYPVYTFGINFTVLPLSTILSLVPHKELEMDELLEKLAVYMGHTYQVTSAKNSISSLLVKLSEMTSENDRDLIAYDRIEEQVRLFNIALSNKRYSYELEMVENGDNTIEIRLINLDDEDYKSNSDNEGDY